MRFSTLCRFMLLNMAVLSGPSASHAQIIFDNTTSPTGAVAFTSLQIGNEIRIAAPAVISLLEIGVNQQGIAGTANLQAYLYANDAQGGQPGTQLWTSTLFKNVSLSGGNDLIPFAVPDIAVPDTFTWTLQISNSTPIAAGNPGFSPPTQGTILQAWFGSPGSWASLPPVDANSYMARITSVPEPGSISLLIGISLSSAAILARRRRLSCKIA